MVRKLLLTFAVISWFTAQAITITIDRADVKTLQPHSSMAINGWRPLTSRYEEIGVNVSPASNLERNAAPLHPVLNKLQEHMAASEKYKPRKNKPQEYTPPSILGSFTVLGQAAAKARGEVNTESKHVVKETKEYSFLLPPPRDTFRFEVDSHKKTYVRDNEPFLRQSQFVSQVHKPDVRNPTYYIKTSGLSTSTHVGMATKNRPVIAAYNVQPSFISQQPTKTFESLKVSSDVSAANNNNKKHFLQIPKTDPAPVFTKEGSGERNYNRYQTQGHTARIPGTSGNSAFYQNPSVYKTTFERDPSFLVHESHEIGYVTPPYEYKYRQPGAYDTIWPHQFYSSTPQPEVTKYIQPVNNNYRHESLKTPDVKTKIAEKTVHPTYYVAEAHREYVLPPGVWHMEQPFKSDINEVLPKVHRPPQFKQPSPNQTPSVHNVPVPPQKVVHVRPELQQQKQYQSSIIPISINQRPTEPDFETPESVSLKHFNEQQFLLQQQLIEQDRRRLREQELERQRELERQQIEEINKRQEEIRLLEQQQQGNVEQTDIKKKTASRQQHQDQTKSSKITQHQRYPSGERERQKPETESKKQEVQQRKPSDVARYPQHYEVPQYSTELPYTEEILISQKPQQYDFTLPQNNYDFLTTPTVSLQEEHRERQPDFRPARPQKPSREPTKRRKPTYDSIPTTIIPTESPETFEAFTEISFQTTTWETISTTPAVDRIRTRKPSSSPTRRRRPNSTTTEPPVNVNSDDSLKHHRSEVSDLSKRRRTKPQGNNYETSVSERKPSQRKRPGHKHATYSQENYGSEVTPDAVTTADYQNKPFEYQNKGFDYQNKDVDHQGKGGEYQNKELEKHLNRYVSNDSYITDYTPTYPRVNPVEYQTEIVTEYPNVGTDYPTVEGGKLTKFEYYEPTSHDNRGSSYSQYSEENLPLEHLFVRTEAGNYETTTSTPLPTAYYSATTPTRTAGKGSRIQDSSRSSTLPSTIITTMTTTTTTTTPTPASTTKAHHRIRPLRYGNATRPRFSVKEYKSRLDYKNKIMQQVPNPSTESSTRQRPTGYRNGQQEQAGETGNRETTGRYKYMSRVSYKTTSTTTPTSYDPVIESGSVSTTERVNKFTPKRRMNANLYRNRFSSSSHQKLSKHESVESSSATHSTGRPENVFSSVRRRVPQSKTAERNGGKKGLPSTEMAAEETSFYNQPTTTQFIERVNEITIDKESVQNAVDSNNNEVAKEDGKIETAVSMDSVKSTESTTTQVNDSKEEAKSSNDESQTNSESASATTYDAQFEEELFAKASQSVADLTSSASALYNKPGMFKAVSPMQESRVVKSKVQLTTEEPTLPIEAFFQELSKKSD